MVSYEQNYVFLKKWEGLSSVGEKMQIDHLQLFALLGWQNHKTDFTLNTMGEIVPLIFKGSFGLGLSLRNYFELDYCFKNT